LTAHPTSSALPQSPITIAVVEDDPSLRTMLVSWFHHAEGFTCLADFPDAESAVAGMAEHRPNVAVVDIKLPRLSGIECVRQLKPRLPDTQFVMLTVYEDSDHIFDALPAGATGYLLKRTPRDELLRALQEVHAGGSPMTSNIARKVVQSLQQTTPDPKTAAALSPRENEILGLLAQGYLYKEIADMTGITLRTVNTHIRRIYEKLHVHSRAQAVAKYANLPTANLTRPAT
jgi:DNA-binding NarL/FixJ family response regulator